MSLSKKHCQTLCAIFEDSARAHSRWADFLALCGVLGADVPKPGKTAGSRQRIALRGRKTVLYKPHPEPTMKKGSVESARGFSAKRRCHPANGGLPILTNLLRYKDYYAHIAFDPSADAFHGRVIGIQDVIDFYGRTPEELREEFKNSVEDYLIWCAEEGTKPEKTWVGKLTIRVDEDLRRRLAVVAAASGASVNAWITALLDRETKRVLQEHEVVG